MSFDLDDVALERDPNLADFTFDAGNFRTIWEAPTGQAIQRMLTSRFGVAALIGAVSAAPSRPPVTATEYQLYRITGPDAFDDQHKQMTGRLIRQIIEHVGGSFVRSRVKVTFKSRYKSGSIYTFHAHHVSGPETGPNAAAVND